MPSQAVRVGSQDARSWASDRTRKLSGWARWRAAPGGLLAIVGGAQVGGQRLALVVEEQRIGADQRRERALHEARHEDAAETKAARAADRAHEHAAVAEVALAVDLRGEQLAHARQELVAGGRRRVPGHGPEDALETL